MRAGAPDSRRLPPRTAVRIGIATLFVVVVVALCSRLDLRPTLGHVHIAVLSGAPEGNYHAVVDALAAAAKKRGGSLENIPSSGSAENLTRLASADDTCDVGFALVQGGMPVAPDVGKHVELVGRLAKAESVMFLGKNADKIHSFADLAGLSIGIGPEESGTARIARAVLGAAEFKPLAMRLSAHELSEQLDLAAKGQLDLAVFVIDEDAVFLHHAIADMGLQIASFSQADVVARKVPHLRVGRIGAGQYDPVRLLPPEDKKVLRVDTVVLQNRCVKRSATLGLLVAIADEFPDFVRFNKDTPNTSGFELSPASRSYFEHEGPELVDEYLPRAGDIMPPSNWAYVVMGLSVLFNLMGLGNRFVLWRIDASRVHAEAELAALFGNLPLGDIARLSATEPDKVAGVERLAAELAALSARCRKQSLSLLVPMGGEMAYRYQEALIQETLSVLHAYRDRGETRS